MPVSLVSLLRAEDAMNARVRQPHLSTGKVQEFLKIFSSVVGLARQQGGYRGTFALASSRPTSPEASLVAFWDSSEAMRASESNLFLTQAISRFLACSKGLPHIMAGSFCERLRCRWCPSQSVSSVS
jgi:hypothetical protein